MRKQKIKKCTINYKGQIYEIRWEPGERTYTLIKLYEVSQTILGFKKYTLKFTRREIDVRLDNNITLNDPELYIKEATIFFNSWCDYMNWRQKEEQTKQAQLDALSNWDGVIDLNKETK